MSPSVGNFVHDLVEMAKAMEELPLAKAELAEAQAKAEAQAETIARREESILRLKAEVEELQSKVRSAEVARDDAEFRFLEADEHISAFRRLVSAFSSDTVALLKAIDPPKPEPVPEAKPMPVEASPCWPSAEQGQSAPGPTDTLGVPTNTSSNSEMSQGSGASTAEGGLPNVAPEVMQPKADPTTAHTPNSSASGQVENSTASTAEPTSTEPPSYANEPLAKWSSAWYDWMDAMNAFYGPSGWPEREQATG